MRELNRLGVTSVDRCRRRVPELPGGLRRSSSSLPRGRADRAHRLQPVHAETPGRARRFHSTGPARQVARPGRRLFPATTAPARCWSTPRPTSRISASRVPTCRRTMEDELERVVRILAQNRWPLRLHATYDETIARAWMCSRRSTATFRSTGLHWFFDHAETVTDRNWNASRARRRHRGAAPHGVPGRVFRRPLRRRGGRSARRRSGACWRWASRSAPAPTRRGSRATTPGSPVLAGDRTTLGGLSAVPGRATAGPRDGVAACGPKAATWFRSEDGRKGRIVPGQLADFAVLDRDYFAVPEEEIRHITAVLTMVGGDSRARRREFSGLSRRRCRRRCRTGRLFASTTAINGPAPISLPRRAQRTATRAHRSHASPADAPPSAAYGVRLAAAATASRA